MRLPALDTKMTPAEIAAFLDAHFEGAKRFGAVIEELGSRRIRVRLPVDARHLRPGGTVSGPTQMTLADTAMFYLVLGHLGPVAMAVTTSLHMDFLRRPAPTDLVAEAELLKLGRRLAVGTVTLYSDGSDDPVSHATVTYSIPDAAG